MRMAEVLAFTTPPAFAVVLAAMAVRMHGQLIDFRGRSASAARMDPATGLLNRRAFAELLEIELLRTQASGRSLSVVLGKVDGLSALDEAHGHTAGAAVLNGVAKDLVKWKRRSDHAAHLEDGVIALLLPETDEGGALILAERLRRAAELTFVDLPGPLSISFGVASHPWHGTDAGTLMNASERAMTAAQALGGARPLIYGPEVARMRLMQDRVPVK
jgi:two-component system, cell cycle response regulator